jgi:putative PEP-CTERM system TPR-repeat lipoprotein
MKRIERPLIVSSLVLLLMACGPKTAEEYLNSAESAIDTGNTSEAVIQLKNAISSDPQLIAPRLHLASIYLNNSRYLSAEKEFLRAQELGAKPEQVVPSLIKINYLTNEFNAAIELANKYKSEDASINDTAELFAFLSQLKTSKAPENITISDKVSPDTKSLAYAFKSLVLGNYEEAKEHIIDIQNEEFEKSEVHYLKGLVAYRRDNYAVASEYFSRVLELSPHRHLVRFQLAESYINAQDWNKAEEVIDDLLSIKSSNAYSNLLKATLRFQQQEFEDSFQLAENAIQNGLDSKRAQLIAGASALKLNELERAYLYLRKAVIGLPKESSAYRMLAQTQLLLGYTNEAQQTLGAFDNVNLTDAGLFAETSLQLALKGDFEGAQTLMSKVAPNQAKSGSYMLSDELMRAASNDKSALANLETLIEKDPNVSQAWVLLAMTHLSANDMTEALSTAKKWQETSLDDGLMLEAVIYEKSNELEQAKSTLKKVLQHSPYNKGATRLLLSLLIKTDELAEAMSLANKQLANSPDDVATLFDLVSLAADSSVSNEARALLTQHYKKHKSAKPAVLALATMYRVTTQPKQTIALLEKHKSNLDGRGWMLLGDTYLQQRDAENAKKAYSEWRSNTPEDINAWLRGIGAEELTNDVDNALELVKEAQSNFPSSNKLTLLEISYLTRKNELSKASELVKEYKANKAYSPQLTRFEGELALSERKYVLASQLLMKNYQESPSFDNAALAARALQFTEQLDNAITILENEFEQLSDKTRARHTLAEFYSFNSKYNRAKELYLDAIEKEPNDIIALNNLSGLLISEGELENAYEYAQRAYERSPNIPQISDTLAWSAFKLNKINVALEKSNEAYKKLPNSMNIALNHVEILNASGRNAEALSLLNKLKPQQKKHIERKQKLLTNVEN